MMLVKNSKNLHIIQWYWSRKTGPFTAIDQIPCK